MDLELELKSATKAALEAGKIILQYYGKVFDVHEKSFDQPVTQADIQANEAIRKILLGTFPKYGWLSEEDIDNVERFKNERVWIVDPLDGTRDFIQKNPEFAVSIGLVENKKTILGVIYNPVTGELFYATKGGGAYLGKNRLTVKKWQQGPIHLIVSHSEFKRGEWQQYKNDFKISTTGGCAYKMCKISRGDADGTFTLNPKSEWDVCAGHVIIEEAGGHVTNLNGSPILYNQKNTILDGLVYCNHSDVLKLLLDKIKM